MLEEFCLRIAGSFPTILSDIHMGEACHHLAHMDV
jgi:hypothetical protein